MPRDVGVLGVCVMGCGGRDREAWGVYESGDEEFGARTGIRQRGVSRQVHGGAWGRGWEWECGVLTRCSAVVAPESAIQVQGTVTPVRMMQPTAGA